MDGWDEIYTLKLYQKGNSVEQRCPVCNGIALIVGGNWCCQNENHWCSQDENHDKQEETDVKV